MKNRTCAFPMIRVFILIIAGIVQLSALSWGYEAKKDSIRISEFPVYNTFMPGNVVKFGIQSGFVFTKHLDTGVDCGARISQIFFHPYFQLTSQIHFWEATKKNMDKTVFGLEESITYQIPFYHRMNIFGGFSLSYMGVYSEEKITENGIDRKEETKENTFESFVTSGLEYYMERNRSFFLECKYGKTIVSREFHCIFGLNFYLKKK
ncbi:hypothetical protein LLG96_16125 [bacterium]|nr:hypothetical protein [bacterium]